MTVAAILNEKGRDIISDTADRTLKDICEVLGEKRIGAIVILGAGGGIEGIVSERDVVRAISEHGPEALSQPASAVMTRKVVTCSEDDTINEVMSLMTSGRFRHLPVLREGRLVGLISIGDVVKHRIAQIEREAEDMRTYIAMS